MLVFGHVSKTSIMYVMKTQRDDTSVYGLYMGLNQWKSVLSNTVYFANSHFVQLFVLNCS